jgi:hypothetical protein
MKVHGDYYASGYSHLERLMSPLLAREYLALLKTEIDRSHLPAKAFMKPGDMLRRPAFELHGHLLRAMPSFHWGLTSMMNEMTERALSPTYCYFRVYRADDVCWVHSDRFACEHSLSLTLGYSDERVWPFEIGRERQTENRPVEHDFGDDAFSSIAMQPGDAVLYQGIFYRHGRVTPNPNQWSAHLFLHWVDSTGPYKNELFDGRPASAAPDFSALLSQAPAS